MRPQRLAMQGAVLRKHKPEAEVVLRMCGIANAIVAAGRAFAKAGDAEDTPEGYRDRICMWIVVAAYLHEAVVILNKRHNGLAWRLSEAGEAAGVTFPTNAPLNKLKTVLNRDSAFIKSCNAIRDRFAFHMDRDPFIEWMNTQGDMAVVGIISQHGKHNEDFVYDAATLSVHAAAEKLMVDNFGELVAEVALAMPYLMEAMVRGFARTKGLVLSIERNEQEDIVLFHEPGAFTVETVRRAAV